ncbi:MAG: protease, partial [Gemmatimonadetes bacterium]
SGILFIAEAPQVITQADYPNLPQTLYKWDLEKRKLDKFVEDLNDFTVSFNGEKLLYRKGEQWVMAGTDEPPTAGGKPKPGEGPLKLDSMLVYVEPREMWKQMYRETWRIERDFFYDPNHHGLDLNKVAARYQPYLDGLASRDDFTYLLEDALGEMTVGHMFLGGGERPEPKKVKGGLLGADYAQENGRYRITRVYDGENWNPGLQAPLTQPGVNVKAGDYLLAVNGRELRSSDNLYSFFEATAGKQVVLKVGPSADGKGSRDVTVVPVESEENLRRFAWIEGNRRKV